MFILGIVTKEILSAFHFFQLHLHSNYVMLFLISTILDLIEKYIKSRNKIVIESATFEFNNKITTRCKDYIYKTLSFSQYLKIFKIKFLNL